MNTPETNNREIETARRDGPELGAAPGSANEGDWADSEEYQAFVAECAKHCRCTHSVCDGVLAGGMCDEIIEDDDYEEEPL